MYAWLEHALAKNFHVVTANRRLARELRRVHGGQQVDEGRAAWPTPAIAEMSDWLAGLVEIVDGTAELPIRINAHSSTVIWERCLRRYLPDDALNLPGIVRQARQSWRLLGEWQIQPGEVSAAASGEDERFFVRAAGDYAKELRLCGWVDDPGLAGLVTQLIRDNVVSLPDGVFFVGFDRQVPSLQLLSQSLENAGCPVTFGRAMDNVQRVDSVAYNDDAEELRAAGAWARGILFLKPEASIGIVRQSLDGDADTTWRYVMEGLAPGWQRGDPGDRNAADVSIGQKLAEFPAIHVALLLLKWVSTGLRSRELGIVLRSKCISDSDIAVRSRLEYELREYPDRVWTLSSFMHIFGPRAKSDADNLFLTALVDVANLVEQFPTAAGPSEWAGNFFSVLNKLGWPGQQDFNSDEFQLVKRWRKLLDEFESLEIVAPSMQLTEAQGRLASLAGDTIYQAETAPGAVHVMGALEAAGLEFDALWVSGLDATQWPPSARPAPLLSRALQRKHGMPDATPSDTLQFAREVLKRLIGSSQHAVLSWSKTKDDAQLLISPLLAELETKAQNDIRDPDWFAKQYIAKGATELAGQDPVPAVSQGERIRGGAYTIDQQAHEPFAAFVRGRLGVRHPARLSVGLSTRHRGIIVHDTLRNLLADRPSRADIAAWSDADRSARIGGAIDRALTDFVRAADPVLRKTLVIERGRLRELMQTFLMLECERGDFFVHGVESEIVFQRGNLQLNLRADRIDRLPDDRMLVIDYKSGEEKSFINRDGEPSDLQLVVYADALNCEVGGLSLVNIDSRLISYKGEGDGIEWARGDAKDWPDRLQAWRAIVHDKVDEFAAGDARVDVLASQTAPGYLHILSRVEEMKRAD